jgi:hypothetical protein
MIFRNVFRDVLLMQAVRTSETLVDNYFTRQYIPEDNSEQYMIYLVGCLPIRRQPGVLMNVFVRGEGSGNN